MTVKVIEPHKANCRTLERVSRGEWGTPWYVTGETLWRDVAGGRRGSGHHWIKLACNSIGQECQAFALVPCIEIEEQAHREIVRRRQ